MKNFYLKTFFTLSVFLLQLYLPDRLAAQCLCGAGVPATQLSYTQTVGPSQASNTIFSFPKFNPAMGTLNCIRFDDTVSVLVTTFARNTDPFMGHNYRFRTNISADVNGPRNSGPYNWNATSAYTDTMYGPLYLEKDSTPRLPGDSITLGPDTLLNRVKGSSSPPDIAPYLGGSGVVNFSLDLTGGSTALSGGTNYTAGITSSTWGSFRLTYSYCPAALLANSLLHLSAYKKDNSVVLKWEAQNASEINQFEIEYSTDGKSFSSVASMAATHSNAVTSYNYNYSLSGNGNNYAYFRIKQVGADGKIGYSAVQKIGLNEAEAPGITIHPNPVTTGMTIAFDRLLNGDYSVDLVNLSGQVVVNKKMKLINSNTIPLSWNNKPAPGIYFTRIVNNSSRDQQIIRVIVQ